MLQDALQKINLDDGHEVCLAKTKELWDKYPDQRDEINTYLRNFAKETTQDIVRSANEIALSIDLCNNKEILPISYISRTYFKKSKSWLYQRINGNVVNGRSVTLSKEERIIFNNALKDISRRIGAINIA